MFTLVGWSAAVDSASLLNLAGLPDPHVRVAGNDIVVPTGLNQLAAVYALGPNVTRAQFQSPSLRRILNFEVNPLDVAAEPVSPNAWQYFGQSPLVLDPEEALTVQVAENAAGASRVTALAWLCDKALAPVTGDIRSVRVSGATTLVANSWSNAALTFDQSLPAGRYQVVGAGFVSAGLQAFRFVGVGSTWRPGCIGFDADSDVPDVRSRYGNMGVWLEFNHNTPPTVDFLSNSADTAETGIIDLIKVA